jgi:3-deoxy-D-manno-octulosonic-acid transferase
VRWLLDIAYLLVALVTAPVWLWRMIAAGKIRTDWPARFGRGDALADTGRPRLLIHAVSVGEVNAVRLLVDDLLARDDGPEVVLAATTDTGYARACSLFAERIAVVRYPFDLSPAVGRFLDRVRPAAVALVELEVWPNFVAACRRRGVPVAVVNGRLTARSAARYARVAPLVAPSFRRLVFAAVQNETYAERFAALGVDRSGLHVTGTMKWDTAEIADVVEGTGELLASMGIDPDRPLVVAGSTAPDEHALLHEAVPPGVQLLCAPRKPEWFDAAARALPGCARRSRGEQGSATDRYLLDTIGELRRAYAGADVIVVGRSFGELHGSDMMEPVALGKAVIVGPAVRDFQAEVDALLAGEGIVQTDRSGLAGTIAGLLADGERRALLAEAGRAVIRREQGATGRNADLLAALLEGERTCASRKSSWRT